MKTPGEQDGEVPPILEDSPEAQFGRRLLEVPAGFKWFAPGPVR